MYRKHLKSPSEALVQRLSSIGVGSFLAIFKVPDYLMVKRVVEVGLSVLRSAIWGYQVEGRVRTHRARGVENLDSGFGVRETRET